MAASSGAVGAGHSLEGGGLRRPGKAFAAQERDRLRCAQDENDST
ncbi:hypothetical protein ATKI12_7385 [Kitasatospora sp. Ki12]